MHTLRAGGWLSLLVLAVASLAVPSGAGGSPNASYTIDRHVDGKAGPNGWYVSNVHVYWVISPQPDRTTGCDARTATTDGATHFDCVATWGQPPNQTRLEDAFDVYIDRTPPTISSFSAQHGNRNVLLSWAASTDTKLAQVTRVHGKATKVVYRGTAHAFRDKGLRPGAKYQYTVTAYDQANNAATKTLAVTGTGPLVDPAPGDRVKAPVKLEWLPVKGATYYNVQLVKDGRVFSAWPKKTSLRLPRSWVYHGLRHRMLAGVYRWYVWPGFGKFAQAHFGRMLGGSAFVYVS
jgi:hypothetical protein